MKSGLLDELMKIPAEVTTATICGVPMQVINSMKADKILDMDPADTAIHECLLANGRFLFEMKDGILKSLFKVMN